MFIDPAIQIVGPAGALSVDAARDGEAGSIKLKHSNVTKLVAIGIEQLVVVDVVVLSKNPFAVRAQIGLRRFPFNLIVQRFLTLVGVGQVELVGKKYPRRQHGGGYDDRGNNAVDAGSRGLDRRNLVRPLHQAKRHQHRQQHDQGSHVVKQVGRYVQQILGDYSGRNLVAQNISQQLEEREDRHQHQKRG